MENNKVILSGTVSSQMIKSHESHGEIFYSFNISIERKSGTVDVIPVIVSQLVLDCSKDFCGQRIVIYGQYRSYNKLTDEHTKLILSVFAEEITFPIEYVPEQNEIILDGYICKKPILRVSPFGRTIADVLLGVNRPCKKSDYIPLVTWGSVAKSASMLNVGSRILIHGRIQSREYHSGTDTSKTAFEVSVMDMTVLKECEKGN